MLATAHEHTIIKKKKSLSKSRLGTQVPFQLIEALVNFTFNFTFG